MTPEMIDILLKTGASAEQIGELWKADIAARERAREEKRAGNAERQQRFRDNRKARKTVRNDSNALRGVTPPIDIYHTPGVLISSNDENEHQARADKAEPFPKPEWADPAVWSDFMANRKAKKARNTATAYAGFLADIARLTDTDWPPGELLRHATAKGWAGIYDPRETKHGGSKEIRGTGQPDKRDGVAKALDRRLGLDPLACEAGRPTLAASAGHSGRALAGPATLR